MTSETFDPITSTKLVDHFFNLSKLLQGSTPADVVWFNNTESKAITEEFIGDPLPRSLFIVKLQESWKVTSTLDNIDDSISTLVIIKDKGVLLSEDQLQVVNLPHIGSSLETLRSLVSFGVGAYFDGLTSENKTETITSTKKKINELALSLQHLEQTIKVPDLSLTVHPIIKDAISQKNANLQNYTDILPDATLLEPSFLNSLQMIVNNWISSIQKVTKFQRDIFSGSAFDEVMFWTSMETSLLSIQKQVDSIGVQLTLAILKYGKRYHATVSFYSDIGISDASDLTTDYNKLMKDLPLNELLAAGSIKKIEEAVILIMNHLKRLRLSSYPISRALPFVEAISSDLEKKLTPMLRNVMSLDFEQFMITVDDVNDLFETWDKQVKEFTNLARELLRKRGEKFIFVKVNSKAHYIKELLEQVVIFRKNHENFVETLGSTELEYAYDAVAKADIFEKSWNSTQKLYENRIFEVENNLVNKLRHSLDLASNSNELFQIFETYQNLIERPRIRGAIQEYQSQLLAIVKEEIDHLQQGFASGKSIGTISKIRDYPETALTLLWGKQIDEKLRFLIHRLETVLGKDWNSYSEGQKIFAETEVFRRKLNPAPILDDWIESVSEKTVNGKVFHLANNGITVELQVNFDNSLVDFFKNTRALSLQGYQIPHSIVLNARHIRRIYPHSIILKESLDILNGLNFDALEDLQVLIFKEKEQVFELITKCLDIQWDGLINNLQQIEDHASHITTFESLVGNIARKVGKLQTYNAQLQEVFADFTVDSIDKVQKVVNLLSIDGYSNIDQLIVQLNKKLKLKLVEKLSHFHHSDLFEHVVEATSTLRTVPALEQTKGILISKLQQFIHELLSQNSITDSSLKTSAITLDFTEEMPLIVAHYNTSLKSIIQDNELAANFVNKWSQFQILWDLGSDDDIYDNFTIANWLIFFDELKKSRELLDSPHSKVEFGSFVVNFEDARDLISAKFSSWVKSRLYKFTSAVGERTRKVHLDLSQGRKSLEDRQLALSSVESTVELLSLVQSQKELLNLTQPTIEDIRKGEALLFRHRFALPSDYVHSEQLENDIISLIEIVDHRSKSINDNKDVIIKSIQSESNKLEQLFTEMGQRWSVQKPTESSLRPIEALQILKEYEDNALKLKKRKVLLIEATTLLVLPHPGYDTSLSSLLEELVDLKSVWISIQSLWSDLDDLRELSWESAKPRSLRVSIEDILSNARSMPLKVRQYLPFQEFLSVVIAASNSLKILLSLKQDFIKTRHLKLLFERLGKGSPKVLTLGSIWDLNLEFHESIVTAIIAHANSERVLEDSLKTIEETWEQSHLEFFELDNRQLVKNFTQLIENTSNDLSSLSSMRNSPVFKTFEKEINHWEGSLESIYQILDSWIDVQRLWIDLSGVFSSKSGIGKILPMEASRFLSISTEFQNTTTKIYSFETVIDIATATDLFHVMRRLFESFSRISKALGDFLEKQRELYPRFYFIGNDDLLEIIGNMNDIERISRHLRKMFSGIYGVEFEKETQLITKIYAQNGETVTLVNPVSLVQYDRLNEWMVQLEYEVKNTLAQLLRDALESFESLSISEFLSQYPLQIVLLSLQIMWTSETEKNLTQNLGFESQIESIDDLLSRLAQVDRTSSQGLIIELSHQKTTLNEISQNPKASLDHSCWKSQQRFYFDDSSDPLTSVKVVLNTKSIDYGFEYLGQIEKLVYTPLLNKCFIAMTGALEQGLGGSPFGPAGTGKTETIKALAQNLGKMVLVFNCDESFDFQAVGRLLSGICQVGGWVCFDEFNRLDEKILSAVSSQLVQIENSIKAKASKVVLLDKEIPLVRDTGIFITLNPLYSGRSQLPENLKKLFRSFSMSKPDTVNISEVLLLSRGFRDVHELSQKAVIFFKRLAEGVSHQVHYDFGLRALKSTLDNAKRLKGLITKDETSILLKSITEMILPRLTKRDTKIFNELKAEVFGRAENIIDLEYTVNLKEVAYEKGLTPSAAWMEKATQLIKIQETQQGIMIVGPASSGKTQLWSSVLKVLAHPVEAVTYVIDPKVISKAELFGYMDSITREWIDGLFTAILRKIIEDLRGELSKKTWIVFDGDVDPVWVESLNSVLDDNKILTLPNGERLKIPANIRFIFEVDSLAYATPATISRCGMIWIENDMVSLDAIISHESFLFKSTHESNVTLRDRYLEALETIPLKDILLFADAQIGHVMKVSLPSMVKNIFLYLRIYIDKFANSEVTDGLVFRSLLLILTWSCSGSSSLSDRTRLSQFLRSLDEFDSFYPRKETHELNIIDYDISPGGEWVQLLSQVPLVSLESHAVLDPNTVIQTVDTVRHESLIHSILAQKRSLILCGPPGSGKTMTLYAALKRSPEIDVCNLNFSKESQPKSILKALEQYCDYKSTSDGFILKPKAVGKRVVLFADEINLPQPDQYGTLRIISFIRQLVEKRGFWRPIDSQWVTISDIQIVGACNPSSDSGRSEISQRLLSHIPVVMVDYPGEVSLKLIYGAFTESILKSLPHLRGFSQSFTDGMLEIYSKSSKKFTIEVRPHYIYSPRELTRWVRGIYSAIRSVVDSGETQVDLEGLVRLWVHEAIRLFSDKLVTQEERDWTWNLIIEVAANKFSNVDVSQVLSEPILYSDWLSLSYQSVNSVSIASFIKERLNVFAEEVLDVDLILYDEAVDHILRIDRVFKQSQGHLILVGPSSSGKTTLTKFVAWMNGLKIHQLAVHRGYSINQFDLTLKGILNKTGVQGEKICFIVDESTILDGAFLERMNSLLANSQIQELFDQDEYALLLNECKDQAHREGLLLDTHEELFDWFTQQVAQNLHVVFTISDPSDPNAPQIISSPALFNRCVLDWTGNWSAKSIDQVTSNLLQTFPIDNSLTSTSGLPYRDAIVTALSSIHKTAIIKFESPAKLLEVIENFVKIYSHKLRQLEDKQRHSNSGVLKLKESVMTVARLKDDLSLKREQLQLKENDARLMLNRILSEQNEAERKQEASIKIQAALERQEVLIDQRRSEVLHDLALAEPAVLEARRGVKNIKKQHLTELRSMSSPPSAVRMTLESVCVLLGYAVETWRDVQSVIRKDDFITNIVNFDCDSQVTPEVRDYMNVTYLQRDDYSFEAADRASKACGPLLQWVEAQIAYSFILDKVGPLKDGVLQLENDSTQTKAQLLAIDDMINELEESIESFKIEYTDMIRETENIRQEMKHVEVKVERSLKLVESLTSERTRWAETIKRFDNDHLNLAGDSLLSAAITTYLGSLQHRDRLSIIDKWNRLLEDLGILFSKNFKYLDQLNTHSNLLSWENAGIPNDDLFLQNITIFEQSIKPVLFIDPFGQFIEILSTKFPQMTFTSFLDDGFVKTLENSLRFGGTLLIQDAEHFDPIISPLLNNDFQKIGGRTLVSVGNHDVDCSKNFKMFLHTRDRSFKMTPFLATRTSIIDFSISESSLESQVLNLVLASEKPEVEKQRLELIKLNGEYKIKLQTLEEKLLTCLSEAKGDILDNTELLQTLENLKVEASQIQKALNETNNVMHEINDNISRFQPFANNSSIIFSMLNLLEQLHPFYQFSLSTFKSWINGVLSAKLDGKDRSESLLKYLFQEIYAKVSPSLKTIDKLILKITLSGLYIREIEGESFLDVFLRLLKSSTLTGSQKIDSVLKSFVSLNVEYDETFNEQDADLATLKHNLKEKLSQYKIDLGLLDSLLFCDMSESFELSEIAGLQDKYDLTTIIELDHEAPIILGTSKLLDPTSKVVQASKRLNKSLSIVALGSKEATKIASREFSNAAKVGDWLLVQNIQTAPEWIETLDQFWNNFKHHPSFRLFLTCDNTAKIPTPLLRSSSLIMFENPPGVKNVLKDLLKKNHEDAGEVNPKERVHVHFLISWFHSILQERERLVPMGFSKNYDFNDADFESAIFFSNAWFDEHSQGRTNISPELIDFDALRFLIGEISYGGKVDNLQDLEILKQLSAHIFSIESFELDYNLITDANDKVTLPENKDFDSYKRWIDKLPEIQPPTWLGLPGDAELEVKRGEYAFTLDKAEILLKEII